MPERVKILLVDDLPENLTALEAILKPLGQELVRAGSGGQALKALLRDEFAVVLLDVVMPGMDGFETADHIRQLEHTKDVPIIFLTGYESAMGKAFRGYSTGAADFLAKPFDPWVLRAKVVLLIELFTLRRQVAQCPSCREDLSSDARYAL